MPKLSEIRKKIRKVLGAILKKLKITLRAAKPIIVKALTRETQFLVALLRKEGLEIMDKLDDKLDDPAAKASEWVEEVKGWLQEHADEVKSEWGSALRIRTSTLNLVRELIYQYRKESD